MKPDNQHQQKTDNTDLSGKETILIVDDEISLLNLATELLEGKGYQTFTAHNAEQALQILENETVDLMLSDIIMPDIDGYQLATIVHDKYPEIKIQLASGFAGDQHAIIEDEHLQHNIIQKPYHAQTLFKHIRELLDNV